MFSNSTSQDCSMSNLVVESCGSAACLLRSNVLWCFPWLLRRARDCVIPVNSLAIPHAVFVLGLVGIVFICHEVGVWIIAFGCPRLVCGVRGATSRQVGVLHMTTLCKHHTSLAYQTGNSMPRVMLNQMRVSNPNSRQS